MTDYSIIKKELIQICESQLNEKKQMMLQSLESLQDALMNESKSSAGDKYETGTEMIQIEKQKIQTQLGVLETNFKLLNTAKSVNTGSTIKNGSLVITDNANYFIGPSLGKITSNENVFFSISPSSPIAQLLLQKSKGDSFEFNNSTYKIIEIC